jgi:hypothetical protein
MGELEVCEILKLSTVLVIHNTIIPIKYHLPNTIFFIKHRRNFFVDVENCIQSPLLIHPDSIARITYIPKYEIIF